MTNVEALKALYTALGGDAADVADATTITAVLNVIAAKYEGADDATTNAEAITNIADVAGSITPEPTLIEKSITANGEYDAEDDNADGYSKVTVNVSSDNNGLFIDTGTEFIMRLNIQSVDIPDGVTKVGYQAFASADRLESVTLPQTITSIDGGAFIGCLRLKNIVIPNGVTSIGTNVFQGCNSLETITINKPEGSITGAPWGAPSTTQVVWTG
jgi:hypothetical protein